MRLTEHFKLSEFSSPTVTKDGRKSYVKRRAVPEVYRERVLRLAKCLEALRETLGHRPVRIVSGYRTPAYNKRINGAKKSTHMYCLAADIKVSGRTVAKVYWALWQLQKDGIIPKGGLAAYRTFVHYDMRGWNARWRRAPARPRVG